MYLDYTIRTGKAYDQFEKNTYKNDFKDYYALLSNEKITANELLWLQAYEGFSFLTKTQLKNEKIAAEIRRYIFLNQLNGKEDLRLMLTKTGKKVTTPVFITGDGKEYESLKDEKLISEMVNVIQRGFKDTNLQEDIYADKIPTNPERMKKKFLLGGETERWPFIRLAFALKMSSADFHKILTDGAFFKGLSAAVPREMILLYCLENEIYDWNLVLELQKYANERMEKLNRSKRHVNIHAYTIDFQGIIPMLKGMPVNQFKTNVLEKNCEYAINKLDEKEEQYSATAVELIKKSTIIKNLNDGTCNCKVTNKIHTVFLTDTISRYGEIFPLEKYDFPKVLREMVMSRNSYFRFLNYRIVAPGANCRVIYSMDFGDLPEELSNSVLSYSKVMNYQKQPHRIVRHDILVVSFYYFLMNYWVDKARPMVASNQEEANALWRSFMKYVNANLQNTGYETISTKNPLDTLIRISMHSANPLECYTRIYELNIFSSLANEGYSQENYPNLEHTAEVFKNMVTCYDHLLKINVVSNEQYDEVKNFSERVMNAYKL